LNALFGFRDFLRIHLGNRMGRRFPDREKRSAPESLPAVPFLYHAVGSTGAEGQVSTFHDILSHIQSLRRSDADGLLRLITFDDGYASSISAIRSLCGMGQPVLWFITTWCREDEYLPKDWLRIVAERLETGRRLAIGGFSIRLLNPSPVYRRWLAFRINRAMMLAFDRSEYLRVLERFRVRYRSLIEQHTDYHLQLASPPIIRELCSEFPSLAIGGHGYSHYRWDRLLTAGEFREEATQSKWVLEEISGQQVDSVAYPYGYRPVAGFMETVRKEYRSGFIAKPIMGEDPYLKPRLAMDGVMLDKP